LDGSPVEVLHHALCSLSTARPLVLILSVVPD
jgi:hypothetical protein